MVFDVTRVSTFEAVQKWKSDIDAKVFLSDNRPIPVVLLANKVRKRDSLSCTFLLLTPMISCSAIWLARRAFAKIDDKWTNSVRRMASSDGVYFFSLI